MIAEIYTKYIEANYKVSTDTRSIIPNSLFFALHGENFDGNKFAKQAIESGACAAVIDNPKYVSNNTILVDDTLKTLQSLANYHRKQNDFKVFALTGTNGKTTTKELINSVLSKKYKCHATQGNFNNHIGVPLTILSAPVSTEILVVEMGANHIGEIEQLCKIAEPDYGLITNIGKAHLEGFGSFDGVKKAKSELYKYLFEKNGLILYNNNDAILTDLVADYENTLIYGSKESDCYLLENLFDKGLKIILHVNGQDLTLKTQLFGEYNILNILAAIKIGLMFQVPINLISEAIINYTPQNNRSQIIYTKRNNTLILDSYNANPSSMRAAIKSFDAIASEDKILILGEMKELGLDSVSEHKDLIHLAQEIIPKKIYLIGDEFVKCGNNCDVFLSTQDVVEHLQKNPINNSIILVKGSRTNKLEILEPLL